ncbi:WD40-like Beta Propeller Repeat [Streptomyces sp. 1222.2]|uniref:TolB family protein n=1 Tax=Streptomyces sp. 1222.2 TaxID=1938833 RepID=UPI000BC7D538|nr:PD40 domain-containing protein [Streptomyces sp. 1222.2]SOD77885.1 WD40-like Beta Propeller Repeat [Streptomyces sp. 1222.2]
MRPSLRLLVNAVLVAAVVTPVWPAHADGEDDIPRLAPRTERISVAPDGTTGGNGHSTDPVVSADGRVVAFTSTATNLGPGTDVRNSVYYRTGPGEPLRRVVVPGETTSTPQLSDSGRYLTFGSYATATATSSVYVMDLSTGETRRLAPAMGDGYEVSYGIAPVSADGRYVAFVARPAVDPNGAFSCRVMLLDRKTDTARRVSRDSDGSKNVHRCDQISMSADGRKVAYLEGYSGPSDDDQGDILVYDRKSGRTVQADATHDGTAADRSAIAPVLSADGSKVGFNSVATDLVPGADPNGESSTSWNAFVRDLRTGTLRRYDGHAPTDLTLVSDLSADGSKLLLNTADANRTSLGLILRDACTGEEQLLSPGQDGRPLTVGKAALSTDESTAVFDSYYPGLVPEDTNLIGDVFVRTLR